MKQSATIYVKGTQTIDGETDTIEFSGEGSVETTERGMRLRYQEPISESECADTTLTLIGETLKIERSGSNEMLMLLQLEKRRECTLNTPMGAMHIGTYCTVLTREANTLHCEYELDINAVFMSKNGLTLRYITDKTR